MKIKRIRFRKLSIPFKAAFQHASATRLKTEAVIAIIESDSGHTGFGEGCPRLYVTGESCETCFQFLEIHEGDLKSLTGIDSLTHWVTENQTEIDLNPAAWCALELALLDLMAKENGCTVETLLSLPELSGTFKYTAVLGVNKTAAFRKQLEQYQALGFQDYKLKVSGNRGEDTERLETLFTAIPEKGTLRLDANNVWTRLDDALGFLSTLSKPVMAVEEPLVKNDFKGHRQLHKSLGIPVILDESFKELEQFDNLISSPQSFIINLRVSKMGGLLRSLEILKEARHLKIPVIIGAQVGETSLLTRAGLTLANAYRKSVIAQEGAFGTHLLEHDITPVPLMFRNGGVLVATESMKKAGLGVDVNLDMLNTSL